MYSKIWKRLLRQSQHRQQQQMLSSWNISEPYSGSLPRLLVPQAAHDGANAADTAWGILAICATTSRVDATRRHFPASCDSQNRDVRIKYAQGETTDNAASDASTDHSMLDARDTAVMAERCPRLPVFALIQWRVWMKNGKTTVRKKLLRQPVCHQAFLVPHLAR